MKYNTLLILIMLSGCVEKSKYRKLKFDDSVNYFEQKMLNHFPDSVPKDYYNVSISRDLKISHPYIWLKYFESTEKVEKLTNELEKKAVAIYNSEDSCLLVIDKHLDGKNDKWFDKKARNPQNTDYKVVPCSEGKLPVPNFYEEPWRESSGTMTGLKGYFMYVLEAKSGYFMDSIKLPNGLYTPEGWTHGYSKGVAINKNKGAIIYWADFW